MKFLKEFTKNLDTKKRILIGLFLLLIMYVFIFLGQPIAALLMVFAFFITLGLYSMRT